MNKTLRSQNLFKGFSFQAQPSNSAFYSRMLFDSRHYACSKELHSLPYELFSCDSTLYHYTSDFDMIYQENQEFNLMLAAQALDGLLIKPGETFSFWQSLWSQNPRSAYQDGLSLVNGQLNIVSGGGLSEMSSLLFHLFLHSPLSLIERHGQALKQYPESGCDGLKGSEAIVTPGIWDLKLRNDTGIAFQIRLHYADRLIQGSLFSNRELPFRYELLNGASRYFRRGEAIIEQNPVYQRKIHTGKDELLAEKLLYIDQCQIDYLLAESEAIIPVRQVAAL